MHSCNLNRFLLQVNLLQPKLSTFLKICERLRISPWRLMYKAWSKMFNYEEQDRNKRKGN